MEISHLKYGTLYGILVWKSLFVYFWVRKTLTLIIKVRLDLGVVLLCFGFNWKISSEKWETAHF